MMRKMPSKPGRDDEVFVKLFVSAYENFAWAGSHIDPLDQRIDGAVEALVTRSDGKTLAIEHTLVEPFVGDKRDFASFEKALLNIEQDTALPVPDHGIIVYVPVGSLEGKKPAERRAIVDAIHNWIRTNRLQLQMGEHKCPCTIPAVAGKPESVIMLTVRFTAFRQTSRGSMLVRRQQTVNDLDKVIEKALTNKLPKLTNTNADRLILFLERDQFTFFPQQILDEIARQKANFPLLNQVDEIWILETVGYKSGGHLDFVLYGDNEEHLAGLIVHNGVLTGHSKDGRPYPMN